MAEVTIWWGEGVSTWVLLIRPMHAHERTYARTHAPPPARSKLVRWSIMHKWACVCARARIEFD